MKTFEQLINYAEAQMDKAFDDEPTYAVIRAQVAICSSLIAIAQEMHKINERAELEEQRQELIQARKDRLADASFAG